MIIKLLISLDIILLLFSISFLLLGGLFYCSTSYFALFYGNISCIVSLIFMIFIYLLSFAAKNNNKIPLTLFMSLFPVFITILSILLTSYNTKKHRKDIITQKVNTNYYYFNGFYTLSLCFVIILFIYNLIFNHFYNNLNILSNKYSNYLIIIVSFINAIFSYFSHYYINL